MRGLTSSRRSVAKGQMASSCEDQAVMFKRQHQCYLAEWKRSPKRMVYSQKREKARGKRHKDAANVKEACKEAWAGRGARLECTAPVQAAASDTDNAL